MSEARQIRLKYCNNYKIAEETGGALFETCEIQKGRRVLLIKRRIEMQPDQRYLADMKQ